MNLYERFDSFVAKDEKYSFLLTNAEFYGIIYMKA